MESTDMTTELFSRRDFSRTIGRTLAFAFAAPHLRAAGQASKRKPAPPGSIRLNGNENPYGPSPKALEALAACGGVASRYPDASYTKAVDAIARIHGVTAENIILGCGSTEILRVADMAFLGPGQNLVAAEPTFEAVLEYSRVTHADAVKVPLTAEHRHDLPRMAAACTSKTGLVYVCNPNNPTGTIVTHDEAAEFIQRVPPTSLVLFDEAYHHFADDPHYATALEWIPKFPNIVVARTFSKVYGMAGMRLGYAVGSKEIIARMAPYLTQDNVNAAVISAALASLNDQAYIENCRKQLNRTRGWLAEQLTKDGRNVVPSQANFVMIDMGRDVKPVIEQFRERRILVGRRFPAMSNFLRVTIGTQDEMEAFLAVFREIAASSGARAA
jgi:histidinol-phosphate aminotransferase